MIHKISAEHLTIEKIGEIIYNGYPRQLPADADGEAGGHAGDDPGGGGLPPSCK